MHYLLFVWGLLAGFYGAVMIVAAGNIADEIHAEIAFLIATVAFGSAGIIDTLKAGRKEAKGVEAAPLGEPFYK